MGCNFHIPVLLKEVIDGLDISRRKVIVDATAGGGGHSKEIKKRIGEIGRLLCIDQDKDAIIQLSRIEELKAKNVDIVHSNFTDILRILRELNIDKTDAILADLGVSSYQIDIAERGFSYMKDAPLDMRMNQDGRRDAYHVVNNYRPERLRQIIEEYGEERYAKLITTAIIKARPIKTTLELAKVISTCVPGNYYKTGGHPAKRTFQAIRIEVNRELEILEQFIKDAAGCLNVGGRLAIITFHSLEDRIVKQTFAHLATQCICPPKIPQCICNNKAALKIITKKPIKPTEKEINVNPRAASAKLRLAEKI